MVCTRPNHIDSTGSFSGAAYLNGKLYLEKDFGTVLVWDPVTDQVERTLSIAGSNNYALAASPTGELFVANGDSRLIRRLNPNTGASLGNFAFPNSQAVLGLAFYDGELLVSTTDDPAKIFRLNPTSGAILGEFTIAGNGGKRRTQRRVRAASAHRERQPRPCLFWRKSVPVFVGNLGRFDLSHAVAT